MFNTTIVRPSVNVKACPDKIDVTHKEAPTAESARLLKDLEAEARDRVIDSYIFEDNVLNGSVVLSDNHTNRKIDARIGFELNGKKYRTEASIDELEVRNSKEKARQMLVQAVSEAIGRQLLSGMSINEISYGARKALI